MRFTVPQVLADPLIRLSPHFAAVELVAMTEPGPERDRRWAERSKLLTPDRLLALEDLATDLEVIRAAAVGRSIRITSSLRSGDGSSQHHHGQAADIQIDGLSPLDLTEIIHHHRARMNLRQVIAETTAKDPADLGRPMGQGSGRWVHVAIRGRNGQRFADAAGTSWATHAEDGRGYPAWRPT